MCEKEQERSFNCAVLEKKLEPTIHFERNQVFKNDPSVNTINCIQLYIFHMLDNIQKDRKLIMKER